MKLSKVGPTTSKGAFTLIELLVVIAIIAVLASLILGISGYVQEKAGNSRAEVEIKALENAIEAYKLDNGAYPQQANGSTDDSTKVLVQELAAKPIKDTPPRKPYMEIPPKMLSTYRASTPKSTDELLSADAYLIDPFGNPYHYQSPGDNSRNGTNFFDLWSYGKNTQKNQGNPAAWIKNW